MKLADIIVPDAFVPQLESTQRDDVVKEMVSALVASGKVSEALGKTLVKQIIAREKKGSTGFGKGVAVPHVKHVKIDEMMAIIGVSSQGVDFNALDKAPVFSVVLLLSPEDRPDEHLQAMEDIFRNLQHDTFRRFLRQATTKDDIKELIGEADDQKLGN